MAKPGRRIKGVSEKRQTLTAGFTLQEKYDIAFRAKVAHLDMCQFMRKCVLDTIYSSDDKNMSKEA